MRTIESWLFMITLALALTISPVCYAEEDDPLADREDTTVEKNDLDVVEDVKPKEEDKESQEMLKEFDQKWNEGSGEKSPSSGDTQTSAVASSPPSISNEANEIDPSPPPGYLSTSTASVSSSGDTQSSAVASPPPSISDEANEIDPSPPPGYLSTSTASDTNSSDISFEETVKNNWDAKAPSFNKDVEDAYPKESSTTVAEKTPDTPETATQEPGILNKAEDTLSSAWNSTKELGSFLTDSFTPDQKDFPSTLAASKNLDAATPTPQETPSVAQPDTSSTVADTTPQKQSELAPAPEPKPVLDPPSEPVITYETKPTEPATTVEVPDAKVEETPQVVEAKPDPKGGVMDDAEAARIREEWAKMKKEVYDEDSWSKVYAPLTKDHQPLSREENVRIIDRYFENSPLAGNGESFVKDIEDVAAQTGVFVDPLVPIAIMGHETGDLKSIPAKNNLGGNHAVSTQEDWVKKMPDFIRDGLDSSGNFKPQNQYGGDTATYQGYKDPDAFVRAQTFFLTENPGRKSAVDNQTLGSYATDGGWAAGVKAAYDGIINGTRKATAKIPQFSSSNKAGVTF